MATKRHFERLPGPRDTLPESPCWHESTQQLFWVDHGSRDLRSIDFPARSFASTPLNSKGNLRFVKTLDANTLIVGSEKGLYRFGIKNRQLTPIGGSLPLANRTCINDGAVHPNGTVAIAVSDQAETNRIGGFYLLEWGTWRCILNEIIIANGPAFSADGRKLYLSDTIGKRIFCYQIDEGLHTVHLDLTSAKGYPDGLLLTDTEELWVSFWDGARIEVYHRDRTLQRAFQAPGCNVTCCCQIGSEATENLVATVCDETSSFENGAFLLTQ
ncbi:SMP-30/gluconolactonase/LRE family protein [Phaeobacter inhibens]|uniref:SMP-30/gluconolactonase/LRE family protein n=1 Tax=Phaeobacter inhibens TaxID=221822 RepID=UPI0009FAD1DC|nr:SMP-30/gluconolactonase/LRE family protein [Phaeobacter inhibens]